MKKMVEKSKTANKNGKKEEPTTSDWMLTIVIILVIGVCIAIVVNFALDVIFPNHNTRRQMQRQEETVKVLLTLKNGCLVNGETGIFSYLRGRYEGAEYELNLKDLSSVEIDGQKLIVTNKKREKFEMEGHVSVLGGFIQVNPVTGKSIFDPNQKVENVDYEHLVKVDILSGGKSDYDYEGCKKARLVLEGKAVKGKLLPVGFSLLGRYGCQQIKLSGEDLEELRSIRVAGKTITVTNRKKEVFVLSHGDLSFSFLCYCSITGKAELQVISNNDKGFEKFDIVF